MKQYLDTLHVHQLIDYLTEVLCQPACKQDDNDLVLLATGNSSIHSKHAFLVCQLLE